MGTPFVIGITGGSGSGKTYFQKQLAKALGEENICLVSHDNYYRTIDKQPKDQNGIENFDTPESIDLDTFAKDVALLKSGHTIEREEYTFNKPGVVPKMLTFEPKPIIMLEGIFVLHNRKVADQIDLKVFIDAKTHLQIKRRIIRDSLERGYDLNDVLYRYENHIMPCYEKYIEVHKNTVDLVVCNNQSFDMALEVLVTYLKSKV
ncbi:uridine kinase [Limibacter armeniacum]|uniref:uridine kinase family protein n=1 Tax=Limibacter armeniacum TaxID=466084 RepID=UPI002FE5E3EE